MRSILKIVSTLIAIGFASCITDGDVVSDPWSIENGAKIPNFSVVLADGQKISSEDLASKRAVIIFFNTDCNDCRRELPSLQTVYDATADDYRWLAIGREQNETQAEKFWIDNSLTIPYSAQPDRRVYEMFASQGIPRLYIVNDMTIVAQFGPDRLPEAGELIKTLKQLLQ